MHSNLGLAGEVESVVDGIPWEKYKLVRRMFILKIPLLADCRVKFAEYMNLQSRQSWKTVYSTYVHVRVIGKQIKLQRSLVYMYRTRDMSD